MENLSESNTPVEDDSGNPETDEPTVSVDDSLTILRQRADRLSEELQSLNAPIPDPPTDESISCDIEQVIQKYSNSHDIAVNHV